jgi:hypothetical protein
MLQLYQGPGKVAMYVTSGAVARATLKTLVEPALGNGESVNYRLASPARCA